MTLFDNEEYTEFVDKFKPKLTTDDCYTPPLVYDAVRDWAVAAEEKKMVWELSPRELEIVRQMGGRG